MKVYLVFTQDYGDVDLIGIESTLENAERLGRSTLERMRKHYGHSYDDTTFKVEQWTIGMQAAERIYLY